MDAIGLIAELKRRRVFRALVGYGIAAFAVLQIIEPVMHGLHWPDAVLSYMVVALCAGFPMVVTLAWIFDVNQGRIERTAPAGYNRRILPVLAGIGALAAAPGIVWYFFVRGNARPAAVEDRNKSVAVLPFASLNPGEDAALFADGIHGDLLTQLSKVSDLKVISRTSVLEYRTGVRNLREISEALGVAAVLEGSVQRVGNRVRIEARLSDARTDRQVWAERYDRELTDVFAIQSAVTEEIARALHARLSPEEKSRIERRPTQNVEAYDLYLRGQEYEWRPNQLAADFRVAEQMYRRAIELDPDFALAHARLSYLDTSKFYWYYIDISDARLAEAKREAERALTLDPNLAESHVAAAYVDYVKRDFPKAVKEFELATARSPNNVTVLTTLAYAQRRMGAFDDFLRNIERAIQLDPRSPIWPEDRAYTLAILRRYPEAEKAFDRVLAWTPDSEVALIDKARMMLLWKGDDGLAKSLLARLPGSIGPQGTLTLNKHLLDLMKLFPREASAGLASTSIEFITGRVGACPRSLIDGMAAAATGDQARARAGYEKARALLEGAVGEHPDDFRYHAALGRAYAGLGRKLEAVREGGRAVELLPVTKDALDGPSVLEDLAAVHAQIGDADAAIGQIEHLLSIPSWLSPALLRIDPKWAPLRDNARFRKLAGL